MQEAVRWRTVSDRATENLVKLSPDMRRVSDPRKITQFANIPASVDQYSLTLACPCLASVLLGASFNQNLIAVERNMSF